MTRALKLTIRAFIQIVLIYLISSGVIACDQPTSYTSYIANRGQPHYSFEYPSNFIVADLGGSSSSKEGQYSSHLQLTNLENARFVIMAWIWDDVRQIPDPRIELDKLLASEQKISSYQFIKRSTAAVEGSPVEYAVYIASGYPEDGLFRYAQSYFNSGRYRFQVWARTPYPLPQHSSWSEDGYEYAYRHMLESLKIQN